MSPVESIGGGPASDHRSALAIAQGVFYASTGLWAIADVRSFQAVTGPKVGVWLVKTVGTLVSVVGAVLGMAGVRRRVTPEIALLGAGCALGLAAIDIIYVARGRISRVYLGDAAAELALAAAWGYTSLEPVFRRSETSG